jgi:hypothetical protein
MSASGSDHRGNAYTSHHHHLPPQVSNAVTEQQTSFSKQATILRKNIGTWNHMLHNPRGEDWTTMLGRANAAFNQTRNLDASIEDVMDHFVIVPKQPTANPSDIPFFLATRLDLQQSQSGSGSNAKEDTTEKKEGKDDATASAASSNKVDDFISTLRDDIEPLQILHQYETNASKIAKEYDEEMIRF